MSYDNIVDHYIKFGYNEGRIYKLPHDFNPEEYRKINTDLSDFNIPQLKNHYLFNGIREGRIYKNNDKSITNNDLNKIPIDFDYKVYKSLYIDLKKYSDELLILLILPALIHVPPVPPSTELIPVPAPPPPPPDPPSPPFADPRLGP